MTARTLMWSTWAVFLSIPVLAARAAVVEEGHAQVVPWSGYWWPHREGALLGPLGKYDRICGRQAAEWERTHHPARPDVPAWHGYCHGWAASAILEKEPGKVRPARARTGDSIDLWVRDQKGLLAASHAQDVANVYGDRYGDGLGSEDIQDLAPDALWRLLKLYVKQQGVPLIVDVEAGPEVWNYPVYAYRVSYGPRGSAGEQLAQLTLWMADNGVAPDTVGVKVRRHSYWFTFQLRNQAVVLGSGRWVGPSRQDHPDFAWYPFVAVPENPEVDYPTVQQLLGTAPAPASGGRQPPGGNPPAAPYNPDQPGAPGEGQPPAQRVLALSPHELAALVANKTSAFDLDATVDRFDGGMYKVGETFTVRVSSARAGYLYLLHLDSQGELKLLYPQPGQDNRIPEQKPVVVPGPKDNYVFRAVEPVGTDRVKAIVTTRPLVLTGLVPAQQPGQAQVFRLPPTQRRQLQDLMRQYHGQQNLKPEQLGGIDPRTVLGAFAQDEVAFYVGK
jgi:hypothetical protein